MSHHVWTAPILCFSSRKSKQWFYFGLQYIAGFVSQLESKKQPVFCKNRSHYFKAHFLPIVGSLSLSKSGLILAGLGQDEDLGISLTMI